MTASPAPLTNTPAGIVHRVGYSPDPWRWTPWEFAPFEGRWDDSEDLFRVIYAGDSLLACLIEVLAPFRPDPAVLAELDEIAGDPADDDHVGLAPGVVPRSWVARRSVGTATMSGVFVDVGAKETLAWLRPRMAARLVHYGVPDLDGAAIRSTVPRRLTREIAHVLYDARLGDDRMADGVRFESRHGNDLVVWAVFERPAAGDDDHSRLLADRTAGPLEPDDPHLQAALELHGLRLER